MVPLMPLNAEQMRRALLLFHEAYLQLFRKKAWSWFNR